MSVNGAASKDVSKNKRGKPTGSWWCVYIMFAVLMVPASIMAAYIRSTGTTDLFYRVMTSLKAFRAVVTLPIEDVRAFIDSYELFEHEVVGGTADESKILAYYRVVNHLCALGEVEKMYIPPVLDVAHGVYGNQLLFEKVFAKQLDANHNDKLLEAGCGRGRIANHIARLTGAKVVGINIDAGQVQNAKDYAEATGLGTQLEFHTKSFNEPLPFENDTFDGFYEVQALTYVSDFEHFIAELHRVLKPGAKLSFLDWFELDAYDESNASHRELLRRTKAILGAVWTPRPRDYHDALQKAGFRIILSKEASVTGHQYPLIRNARDFFFPVGKAVEILCQLRILPMETDVLLKRLNLYVEDFIVSDEMGLFTTSYHIIAQKE